MHFVVQLYLFMRYYTHAKLENKIKQVGSEHKITGTNNTLLELKENRKALDKPLTYKAEGVWSQNSDFKIWHPKKKLALKTKPVLKKETLALKHLY